MSYSVLNELRQISAELCSEKVSTRNKAVDNFYNTLSNSKNDIIKLYRESTEKVDPSWGQIFNNSVDAAISHSVKVHEAKDSKGVQTLRNRNHLYSTIINKLIDYSLEDNNNFLLKSTVLSAFFSGFDNKVVVKNFGRLFLQILERGVYESDENCKDLKANEYSKILSVLFETNVPEDPTMKSSMLRCINKTLELCQKNVQLGADYKEYFDDLKTFALDARDDSRQADVIKMFYLFTAELSIDYHVSVCGQIQEILPILCGFYNYRMRTESKTLLFRGIYCSLNIIYPNLSKGDYNPIGMSLGEDWPKTLRKLMAVVEMEAKERTIQQQRSISTKNSSEVDIFIKASAIVVYLIKWGNTQSSQADDAESSRAKISRNSDQLESILESTMKDNSQVIQVWLEIFVELIETQSHLINPSNYMTILESFQRSLLIFNSWQHLRSLRLGFTTLLRIEEKILQSAKNNVEKWTKIVEFLIADTSNNADVLREKQSLLRELIRANKFCIDDCTTLLSFFLSNNTMRCNDCFLTIREIMRCNENCGFDKTSDLTGKLLTWLNQLSSKMDGKSLLLHMEPLNEELIADTNAVMVINFLDSICPAPDSSTSQVVQGMELLNYKYCRKYICIEQHGKELKVIGANKNKKHSRCLIQSNYELLMRLLNFETSPETKMSNINVDLSRLLKMVLLLRKFFDYEIFDESSYLTCPLIKRIGFFLDNVDFQLKNIAVNQVSRLEISEAMGLLSKTFSNICSSAIFLKFLEKQQMDGIIAFVGSTFKFSESNNTQELKEISEVSLQLLSTMCASPEHASKAFSYIKQQRLSTKTKTSGILAITKIFCQQQQNQEIAVWFVEKLKTICQLYYTNVEVSEQLVDLIPDLVRYVEPFYDELHTTFVIISSFLKITSKKSYSSTFAAKLINSIRQTVKLCPKLIASEGFTSICLSLTKLLLSQNLAVSLSVVTTITALMDSKWVHVQSSDAEKYFQFCCTLYSHLEWNKLPTETDDVKQNSACVTVQLLTSLFAFSTYHREIALQELGNYYSSQGLSESYFRQFSQIAAYHDRSLFAFTKPYIDSLLHAWLEKKNPMSKFPYFLCLESRTHFFSTYLPYICYYQLRFSPTEGFEELIRLKYGRNKQIVLRGLPLSYAFLLNLLSGNTQSPSPTYAPEARNMLRALKTHNFDLATSDLKIYWTTISSAAKQLWDEAHFASIFGFNFYSTPPAMSVNFISLKHNLQHYLEKCYKCSNDLHSGIDMLIKSDPMALLSVLTAFKLGTCDFVFLGDKMKSFYWFCAVAEIVIDSISKQLEIISTELSVAQSFFLRDILFFILNIIDDPKTEAEILKAGLHFLTTMFDRNISTFTPIIGQYLNEIACSVISIAQKHDQSNIEEMAIGFLELIVCQHKTEFFNAIKLLDKFPDSEAYQNLRDVQRCINTCKESDLCWVTQDFLNSHTKGSAGIRSMKQCIAERKCDIRELSKNVGSSKNLLYDLLKRLVDIVRASDQDLSIESAKCLGEIGSVKICETSFYFEGESTFYDMETVYQDEMEYFIESSFRLLDKLLLRFDSVSSLEIYAVCKDLAKSKIGSKALGIFPMFGIFAEQYETSVLDSYSSIGSINFVDILMKHENLTYNEWIKSFSSDIFRHCQWESFAELCELSFPFSEFAIVPIFKVLMKDEKKHFDNIVGMLDLFFVRTFEAISNEESNETRNIYSDKRVIKTFLNICECLRIRNEWKVPLNILNVAKACIYCQAYFMGILYLEMWALEEKEKPDTRPEDVIKNSTFQEVAMQAYTSIDCSEAISGFLDPLNSRLEYLSLKGDWSQVLMEIDAANESNRDLYVRNLKSNGLLLLSSSEKLTNKRDYECCWRLAQWDTAIESNANVGSLNDLEYEFEKNHFNALKSIYNKEEVNCLAAIDKARQAIVSILKEISTECLQSIYKYLTWLHMLQQAEDFCKIQFLSGSGSLIEEILQKWKSEQDLEYGNFNCTELVLSHQMTLYKTAGIRAGRKINEFFKDKSAVGECILKCINVCKNTGNINLAIRNVALLKNIETSETTKAQALLEDADICRRTGKNKMAKEILYNVMLNKNFVYCLERIHAHRMYGELLLETNSETFDVVHEEIFARSVKLLNKYADHKEKVMKTSSFDAHEFDAFDKESRKLAFATIAKYADKEYTQLNTYMNSETFRTKVEIMEKNKQEASTLAKQTKDRDKAIGINVMRRNCDIDSKEIKMQETKRSDNLCIAMENYIQFCMLDEAVTSPAVYRIIALWFANKHDERLHAQIESKIDEIPSYKFLCVLNQMSARLGSRNSTFQSLLGRILVKCIEDHPHHTLYKILALVFAHADDPRNATRSDRESIAKDIINKARNKSNMTCIKQMETMFTALIDFANKDAGKATSLLLNSKMKSLKNLDHVQCPTQELPVALNKEYSPTYIRKWEDNVGLVGGINAPKKLMCICSDGIARPQLLKGKDDLRQDAVMQQVLAMVNELLKSDPETNEQKLLLRTYKVIPLSMRSGILEWCNNTIPLGMYLCGDKENVGAHAKYRPKDFSVGKCRKLAMEVHKTSFNKQFQTYQQICKNIQPVFHYFFFEKFLIPGIWFERRLAYIKSVATTSIVGFILGLGDRHTQNILIDKLTAEVIHIDFGIAFEQGKIMPTPETVPFRLTRDIVAPMGVCKTDGVFTKICEKTMKILRKNDVFLTTILEVLLYDPLYVWKWSSQKLLEGDCDINSEEKNLTAQRALLRVQDKLEGKEEGQTGAPTVEVQVERLINEAMNPHNLCRLYPGWDPYL